MDYFQTLGIPPPPNSGIKEVRKAYRSLALRFHPDKAGPASTTQFQKIQAAYEHALIYFEKPASQRQMHDEGGARERQAREHHERERERQEHEHQERERYVRVILVESERREEAKRRDRERAKREREVQRETRKQAKTEINRAKRARQKKAAAEAAEWLKTVAEIRARNEELKKQKEGQWQKAQQKDSSWRKRRQEERPNSESNISDDDSSRPRERKPFPKKGCKKEIEARKRQRQFIRDHNLKKPFNDTAGCGCSSQRAAEADVRTAGFEYFLRQAQGGRVDRIC